MTITVTPNKNSVGFQSNFQASNDAFRGGNLLAISLATTDYTNANAPNGFYLYVGGTGNITVDDVNGNMGIVFNSHPVGYTNFRVSKVYKTGTTATNLVALY
jgi:hypothetical protein